MAQQSLTQSPLQLFIADFQKEWQDKLSPDALKAVLAPYSATQQSYPATGSVTSFGVKADFTIDAQFLGEFNGWATPLVLAEGSFSGTVYCNNPNILTSKTHAYYFWMALGYTHLTFYDIDGNNLGYFSGSSYSIVAAGAGVGSWKTI